MAISAELSAQLTTLTKALDGEGYPGVDVAALLGRLDDGARGVVAAYVGLRFTLVVDGDPVTLTTVRERAQRDAVVSSLTVRLDALRAGEPGSVLILYASAAGAFVDLATQLGQAFSRGPHDVVLDQDLTPLVDQSDPRGPEQYSMMNHAIGVLRARGHTLDEARDELHRLVQDARTTVYAAAQQLIRALDEPPEPEHQGSGGSSSTVS